MKKIGEILVENGILTEKDLEKALERQKDMATKKPIGEVLIEMELITIDTLLVYLEKQLREKF